MHWTTWVLNSCQAGMQGMRIRAAQSQDEGIIALPKQFYLGFASSLGITKEISRTQVYSVWLQGKLSNSWWHQHSPWHHTSAALQPFAMPPAIWTS